MKLYHITENLGHDGVFTPSIPKRRGKEEDDKVKRICFSTSIEGCLSSVCYGGNQISEINGVFLEDESKLKKQVLKVFVIHTEEYGIKEDNIITPDVLYRNHRVDDAEDTQEHWVTVPVSISKSDSFLMTLEDWDCEEVYLPSHEMMELAEEKYDGCFIEAYDQELGIGELNIPDGTILYDAKIKHFRVRKGETKIFYVEQDKELFFKLLDEHGVDYRLSTTFEFKNGEAYVLFFSSGKNVLKALAKYSSESGGAVSIMERNPDYYEEDRTDKMHMI